VFRSMRYEPRCCVYFEASLPVIVYQLSLSGLLANLRHVPTSSAGCLELDVVWRFPSAAAALQASVGAGELLGEEAASASLAPAHAAEWHLLALSDSYERDTGHRGFVLRPGEHAALPSAPPEYGAYPCKLP